jgi:hypothetical protein
MKDPLFVSLIQGFKGLLIIWYAGLEQVWIRQVLPVSRIHEAGGSIRKKAYHL